MGLASIPRGVGHNFVPEYQISAVPYIVDFSSYEDKHFIFSKNGNKGVPENTIVGEATAANGIVTMTNTDVALTDVFTDTNGNGIIEEGERKANNLIGADFQATQVFIVKLPKISQWIQFLPTTGNADGIKVGFSKSDINLGKEIQFIEPTEAGSLPPLRIRCTNLYFKPNFINGKLLVGLTSIDRSEFTEVVETFLGD